MYGPITLQLSQKSVLRASGRFLMLIYDKGLACKMLRIISSSPSLPVSYASSLLEMKMGRPLVALAPPMSISSTHTKGKRRSTNKTNIAKIQRSDCPSFLERGMAERKAQSVRRMKGGKSWRGRGDNPRE